MRLRRPVLRGGPGHRRRLLAEDATRREQIAQLGCRIAADVPETGFRVVELAAESAIAQGDWPGAAAVIQEFATSIPESTFRPSCGSSRSAFDGGLQSTMYGAQAQLADAYIEAGQASEARFIAEDLVAREPWDAANIERFRRTLTLLGEAEPDASSRRS
jgi:hypothetical protein